MTFEALDDALQRAKSGDEQPIRSLFSFLKDALLRAEEQRDAYLASWNKAAAGQDRVKPPSEPKPSSKSSSPKPQASQKVIETEEDLGL